MNSTSIILPAQHPMAQDALKRGYLIRTDGKPEHVVARMVIESPHGNEVLFETIYDIKKPKLAELWVQTTRAFSLTATVTPCLAIWALHLVMRTPLNTMLALTATLGVLFLQVAINILNDVEDYRRLIDLPGTLGGSGVIQKGWWTPTQLTWIARTSLFLGVACGLFSVLRYPETLMIIAAAAFLGVLRYSARAYGLKYYALGDVAVWILCGPALAIGFSTAATGTYGWTEVCIGSFFGWLAVGILHANNLQDMYVDQKRGVRTLALALGFNHSIRFLGLNYVFGALSVLGAGVLSRHLVPFLPAVLVLVLTALPWYIKIRNALAPESALLVNCRMKAAEIHLASGMALFVSLVIAWAIS